jgi:MoCo/4Fe-4S cofactor protein with predicted Tat translocation signal
MKDTNKYWGSLEELERSESFIRQSENEFFELPALNDIANGSTGQDNGNGHSRRDFLKYLGFSLGAATIAAACETPVRRAVPYVVKPDAIVPGVATYYASTYVRGGEWVPVLVKTREGRPIKIEGNASCKSTQGGTSARSQASVLDLYDVARFRHPGKVVEGGKVEKMSWEDLDGLIKSGMSASSRIRILTSTNISPSYHEVLKRFQTKYPNAQVVTYDAVSSSALLDANEKSFGRRVVPAYNFSKAKVIVSLGADFLGTWISPVEYARQFSDNRKIRKIEGASMNRLIVAESMMSLTGSNADNRILIRPSEQGLAIAVLHNAVAGAMGGSKVNVSGNFTNPKAMKALELAADDLVAAARSGEETLVVSNSNTTSEQIMINHLNAMLGNYGKSIDLNNHSFQRQGSDVATRDLYNEMVAGNVDVLIVCGDANPVYDLPEGAQFRQAMANVGLKICMAGTPNETMANCDFACPGSHTLESWGDAQPTVTTYSLIQPTIAPLFDTRQEEMSFLTWAEETPEAENGDHPYYVFLKDFWQKNVFTKQNKYSTFRAFWDNSLHDGIVHLESTGAGQPAFNADVSGLTYSQPSSSDLEISFYEKVAIGAGQFANNPWLQEMPDPITRVVWDNYLCIPLNWDGRSRFEYFNNLKEDGNIVEVTIRGNGVKLPVVRQFGMPQNTVAVALGFGREVCGKAGIGVGQNLFPHTARDGEGNVQYYVTDVAVSNKIGHDKKFASVQHHHTMGVTGTDSSANGDTINVDEKALMTLGKGFQGSLVERSILRSAHFENLESKVKDLQYERKHHQKLNSYSLYPGHDEEYALGHHWGMAVDLTSCIGCGACQVACMSENNVPVVGKEEVSRHHEMTWMRIDRYYYGDAENPNVVYQPMMCQHCDNAPCENVCPVSATNHSSEGLNQMAYNRCVGTRYCANNCPYKVRRFNWLDYNTADLFPVNENDPFNEDTPFYGDNLTRMVLNPDVTVRSRGVIEKCSFCVQRIQEGKLRAKSEGRALRDGDVKSACQTACPTGAIVFGDMNDKESEVSKLLSLPTNYYVLEETNVRSSVGYQMKVTNPNSKMTKLDA